MSNEKKTDFQSLSATPDYDVAEAAAREREATKVRTDFQSLKAQLPEDRPRWRQRTATDHIIDAMTPLLIFVMIYTLVFYLLDVRFIYSEVHDANLRGVAFLMVMGIVALNRLIARDGSEESFLYIILLGGAIGFYTWTTTSAYDVGSIAPGFMNRPGVAALFNMTMVGLLWWATNRLMHECCIDENKTAGDIGILTGTARNFQRSIRRSPEVKKQIAESRRAKDHLLEANVIDPIDPHDFKPAEEKKAELPSPGSPSERLSRQHPGISIFFFSVPAMAMFVFGLPVLRNGGDDFVRSGHVYVGVYTICALALLMLTSLGGLREYFRSRRVEFPAGIGWFWVGLGTIMIAAVMTGALQLPLPDLPRAAVVEEHVYDYWRPNSTFELVVSPGASTANLIEQTRTVERIGQFVLLAMGLFLLFSAARGIGALAGVLGRNRDYFPPWVIDLFDDLDTFLERVIRLPELPKRIRPLRVRPNVARSTPFHNPMGGEGDVGTGENARSYIAHSYDALCALADDLGVPRYPDQTPYEFIQGFPKELRGLRQEAHELTVMYVRSEYSELPLDEKTMDRLRRFWMTYERVRGRHIR